MNPPKKPAGEPARGPARVARLAERELPPRVRRVLEGMVERTAWFEPTLSLMFDEVEQNLFKQADRARSNEQQSRMMEAIRELKRRRADGVPRFLAHVESTIARFDDVDARSRRNAAAGASGGSLKLELVESADLELSLAMQDIANKAEIRHSQALHELGHRFGVIAGQPASVEQPADRCRWPKLRYAQQEFDSAPTNALSCSVTFDRTVMASIGTSTTSSTTISPNACCRTAVPRARGGGHDSGGAMRTMPRPPGRS